MFVKAVQSLAALCSDAILEYYNSRLVIQLLKQVLIFYIACSSVLLAINIFPKGQYFGNGSGRRFATYAAV